MRARNASQNHLNSGYLVRPLSDAGSQQTGCESRHHGYQQNHRLVDVTTACFRSAGTNDEESEGGDEDDQTGFGLTLMARRDKLFMLGTSEL